MTPVLAQRRADRSFERIYRRHVGDVYRYALAVLRNPSDAEDVTQTTFLNAYRAFERGERPQNPQNWLIAIAHNVCRQRFRHSARRPEEVAYDDGIGDPVPEEDQGPTAEDIQRALGHLAFNQRAALVMRELEGRSYAEIAEILGVTVSAVETLLFRARRAIREQLEGALTCTEAERAISRRADGRLARADRGALRAHLRECKECDRFARSQRAQRSAFKALATIPIPASLTSLFGGSGGIAVGAGMATKAAAVVAVGVVATSVGHDTPKNAERLAAAPPDAHAAAAPSALTAPPVPVARRPAEASVGLRPPGERGPSTAAAAAKRAGPKAAKATAGRSDVAPGRALGHEKQAKRTQAAPAEPRGKAKGHATAPGKQRARTTAQEQPARAQPRPAPAQEKAKPPRRKPRPAARSKPPKAAPQPPPAPPVEKPKLPTLPVEPPIDLP